MIDKEILDEAIQTYGTESQLNMAVEECSEFIDAIMKFRRGRVGVQEVVTEIADVMIVMEQMAIIMPVHVTGTLPGMEDEEEEE